MSPQIQENQVFTKGLIVFNGLNGFIPFEDALTPEELAEFESMDPDVISDEDLFE